jgi:hypothetical protein
MTVGKAILLKGLSTDTKPTRYSDGTLFLETDTLQAYSYDATNTVWNRTGVIIPTKKHMATWSGHGLTTGFDGFWNGSPTPATVTVGTGTSNLLRDSSGFRMRYDTGTTANSIEGTRINSSLLTERDLNPETHWRIKGVVVSSCRIFIGFTSATAAPASSADYLNALSGVGFWADTGVDTNWHIMQNSGSGASDTTTIANVGALNTTFRDLGLRAVNASAKFQYSWDGGAWTDISTKVPAATTALGWVWYIENTTTTNNQIGFAGAWSIQDHG